MIREISIEDAEEWDLLVRSFHKYDVYYLSGYTKAFMIHGDGTPVLFYYEDNGIRAVNVVMQRDIEKDEKFAKKIPSNTYFDIVTPYGYGGFLIEGNTDEASLGAFENEYQTYCNKRGIISEFVRFHPVLKNSTILESYYDISKLGKTITITMDTKEQIWKNLTSKNRNMVRKASKSGVQIFYGRSKELLKIFIPLYNTTMDKDEAKPYYYFGEAFYNSLLYDLKYNAIYFYAVYEDKIIAMSIVLLANGYMNYHLSASDRVYQHLAPTNLLLYEAACWGCEHGFRTFHLGGGVGSRADDLFRFKNNFNRNSDYTFSVGEKIFNQPVYQELVEIRLKEHTKSDENFNPNIGNTFFPRYRGID